VRRELVLRHGEIDWPTIAAGPRSARLLMTWVSALRPFLCGGVAGSLVSFGLSWARENRRSLDAYRTPQRQAVEDIVTATHAALVCELEARTELTELIGQIGSDEAPAGQAFAKMVALGKATLDVERAFQIGSLTLVDPPCFEAMGVAYFALTRLRTAMKTAPEMHSPEEFEHYVAVIEALAAQLDNDVSALVRVANQQLVPAGQKKDRRLRDAARRRLGERFKAVPASPWPANDQEQQS
jgi:hypothetical protein